MRLGSVLRTVGSPPSTSTYRRWRQRLNRQTSTYPSRENSLNLWVCLSAATWHEAGRHAIAPTAYFGQFSSRRVHHLGAHSPSEVVEGAWRQVQSAVTSHLTQRGGLTENLEIIDAQY